MSRQMAVIGTSLTVLAKGASKTAPMRSSTMNAPAMTAVRGPLTRVGGRECAEEAEGQKGREGGDSDAGEVVVVLVRGWSVLDPFAGGGRAVRRPQCGLRVIRWIIAVRGGWRSAVGGQLDQGGGDTEVGEEQ